MKHLKLIGLAILVIALFIAPVLVAQNHDYQVVLWNDGSLSVTDQVLGDVDTSDVFTFVEVIRGKNLITETSNILMWVTEKATADSSDVDFVLELSVDSAFTYPFAFGALATVASTTGTETTTTGNKNLFLIPGSTNETDLPGFEFGRIIATVASSTGIDTVSYGAQFNRTFR